MPNFFAIFFLSTTNNSIQINKVVSFYFFFPNKNI